MFEEHIAWKAGFTSVEKTQKKTRTRMASSNTLLAKYLNVFAPFHVATSATFHMGGKNERPSTFHKICAPSFANFITMTVEEYLSSSKLKRAQYRIYRNPFFLFFIAPFILFGILNRFPNKNTKSKEDFFSLVVTNVGILTIALITSLTLGLKTYLLIQLPVLFFASIIGVWLFFVQHQFEEVYWQRHQEWDFVRAAIEGSSFYKLPLVLDWMTGHIGYHHIHHLNPRIPNYHLRACYRALHDFKGSKTITLFSSFKMALLNLYDEKTGHLVRIRDVSAR